MREDNWSNTVDAAEAFARSCEPYGPDPVDPADAAGINDPLPHWVKPVTMDEWAAEVAEAQRQAEERAKTWTPDFKTITDEI